MTKSTANGSMKNRLRERFPVLLRKTTYGCDCGEGWWNLIVETLERIWNVVEGCVEEETPFVSQIKEKFGQLRIYMDNCRGSHATCIRELLHVATERSGKICEECGQPGNQTKIGGWYKTLCVRCQLVRLIKYTHLPNRLALLIKHGETCSEEDWEWAQRKAKEK